MKVFVYDPRKVRDRRFGLFELGMPNLLPFKRVVALIPALHQQLDLPFHRNVSAAGERIMNTVTFETRILDRKSTRLNSSHQIISYAVFCLKKKKQYKQHR